MDKKKYVKRLKKRKKQEQKQAVPEIPTADKHHLVLSYLVTRKSSKMLIKLE